MTNEWFSSILFHALYDNSEHRKPKHPLLYISLKEFETCLNIFLDNGFTFLDPSQDFLENIQNKQIILTFDDGYFNNFKVLEILSKYSIKALFFCVKHQIEMQKLFWWDAYFLEREKTTSFPDIYEEIQRLKKYKYDEIEELLLNNLGADCFIPQNDLYRPMSVKELKIFAQHKNVGIGVHSAKHEILINKTYNNTKNELVECKSFLEEITGKKIDILSYPNGDFNPFVMSIADELGFKYGFTTIPGINKLQTVHKGENRLSLKRACFPIPYNHLSVVEQVKNYINEILLM